LPDPSDEDLILRAREGDEDAFFALYERHKGGVFRFARRMLADEDAAADVVQDCFEYFFRKIPTWRFEAKPSTLLFRAARNRCLNALEKRRRRGETLGEEGEEAEDDALDPASLAETADLSRRVARALATLDPGRREVVALKVMKGLSYDRIGEILGIPAGTVKSRLHKALEELREKMKGS